jgi:hypothetical protein
VRRSAPKRGASLFGTLSHHHGVDIASSSSSAAVAQRRPGFLLFAVPRKGWRRSGDVWHTRALARVENSMRIPERRRSVLEGRAPSQPTTGPSTRCHALFEHSAVRSPDLRRGVRGRRMLSECRQRLVLVVLEAFYFESANRGQCSLLCLYSHGGWRWSGELVRGLYTHGVGCARHERRPVLLCASAARLFYLVGVLRWSSPSQRLRVTLLGLSFQLALCLDQVPWGQVLATYLFGHTTL